MRRLALLLIAIFTAAPALAHPHLWVKSSSEVIYAEDGSITGVRHAWTFDDMFSAYALQGIETKTRGVYTREELAPLAQTNVESLKEYAYFTFAKADGRKQRFNQPVDYFLDYRDSTLVLHFTLPFRAPFKAQELQLEIYDPEYFIDFQFQEKEPVKLVGAAAACTVAIVRADNGAASAQAQKLGEENFASGRSNFGAMFANKATVTCP